jgi:single-strand DNA-binding protein
MNKVILMGRLTRDPEVRYAQNNNAYARFSLAVDRRFKKDGEQDADFISCVTFGKNAEFAEKYLKKGTKIALTGRIQTGSYTNKEGQKVYTTDVVVDEMEFAESKNSNSNSSGAGSYGSQSNHAAPSTAGDGFMNIPEGMEEELPFI